MTDTSNVVALAAAKARRVSARAAHLVYDLDTIKDDIGMPAGDTTNDAWLERQIASVWARFEKVTARYLCVPPAQFVDDWSRLASAQHIPNAPPILATGFVGSPFLRCCPVVSIDAMQRNGQAVDPVEVRFEPATGKLFSLSAASWHGGHDVSGELAQAEVAITYTAGWDEIPPDLYSALCGVLGVMWGQRSAQAAGVPGGGGAMKSINVVDVGTIELGTNEGNAFVGATMKGVRIVDPLLGPWGYLLEEYIDYRVQIGSPLIPVTEMVEATP